MSIARREMKSKTKSWKTQGQEDRKKKTNQLRLPWKQEEKIYMCDVFESKRKYFKEENQLYKIIWINKIYTKN